MCTVALLIRQWLHKFENRILLSKIETNEAVSYKPTHKHTLMKLRNGVRRSMKSVLSWIFKMRSKWLYLFVFVYPIFYKLYSFFFRGNFLLLHNKWQAIILLRINFMFYLTCAEKKGEKNSKAHGTRWHRLFVY